MSYKAVIRKKQRCRYIAYTILCFGMILFTFGEMIRNAFESNEGGGYKSRHILQAGLASQNSNNDNRLATHNTTTAAINSSKNESSCRIPSIAEFPRDFFTNSQRKHGALIIHLLVGIYMCVGLATVCDYYFVPSLEVLCHKLKIQPDVAGASLMAIGSSAPELCASVIGVFVTQGDIGIGTILGSAVFNLLFVVGACGIVATSALQLSWWSLTRDTLCYCLTLVILAVVIFDSAVKWQEAVAMFTMYIVYLIFMSQNQRIEKGFYTLIGDGKSYQARFHKNIDENTRLTARKEETNDYGVIGNGNVAYEEDHNELSSTSSEDEAFPDDPPRSLFLFPDSILQKIGYLLVLPLNMVFFITIPDLRRPKFRKCVALTFFMSITWIGFLTYTLVWMVTTIGFTIDIPDSVMGLTFVAFGSSVPDGLASVIVAKQGKGDMAVSQTLGSNVFDILLGLGLPWMIKSLMNRSTPIHIQSSGMLISCFVTFIIAMLVLLTFYLRKFILGRNIGIALLITYATYLVAAVVTELILYKDLPLCRSY